MSKDKLKPCPFCGSKAIIKDTALEDGIEWYLVYCFGCGANFQTNRMEFSVEKWNKRTIITPPKETTG